jgi:hypothetical protein
MSAKIINAEEMRELNNSKKKIKKNIQAKLSFIITKIKDSLPLKRHEYVGFIIDNESYVDVAVKLRRLGYHVCLIECTCLSLWECENAHFAVMLY